MCSTALPPPPPTPITLMTAELCGKLSTSSNILLQLHVKCFQKKMLKINALQAVSYKKIEKNQINF
jgi:hypothetical protein